MAVPKRRTSHSRKNQRRAHHALKPEGLSVCKQCKEPKLPHRICKSCGSYGGRIVLDGEEN